MHPVQLRTTPARAGFFHQSVVTIMRFLTICALCLFSFSALGCGTDISVDGAMAKASKDNIQKCCAMYAIYSTLNNYKGPTSKEEMLDFLASEKLASSRLERMSIDPAQLDSYTVGRDGEPLQFRWGVESSPIAPAYVVCWEQIGIDGKVQVGITGGKIVETDDEDELEELKAGIYESAGGATYGNAQNTKSMEEEN